MYQVLAFHSNLLGSLKIVVVVFARGCAFRYIVIIRHSSYPNTYLLIYFCEIIADSRYLHVMLVFVRLLLGFGLWLKHSWLMLELCLDVVGKIELEV